MRCGTSGHSLVIAFRPAHLGPQLEHELSIRVASADHAVADAYCRANNLDLSPEADSGAGPVDFKVSAGYSSRVLVELKLSTNPKIVQGYERQLAAYKKAESTSRAIYLIVDVGGLGNKDKRVLAIRNEAAKRGDPVSDVVFVNGKKQKSASKR